MNFSKLKYTFLVSSLASTLGLASFADDANTKIETAGKLLDDAIQLHDQQKLDQAASLVEEQLKNENVAQISLAAKIQNIAQCYQILEQQKLSLEWWQKLLKLEPQNWRAWAKVIQCSQALNDLKQRDAARETVIDLNKQGKVDQKMFCREQFNVGDKRVMAMEYFVPDTKFGVELAFRVTQKDDLENLFRRYTLGEAPADTQVARELKEIGPDDHMYSIDGFAGQNQWLLKMTTKKPSYEEVRTMVVADIAKERPADSKPSSLKPNQKSK